MGFSSFLDAKTGSTIPAYPWAECPLVESEVVMVLPDDTTIEGVYDGYGRINDKRIYEILAPYVLGAGATESDVFSDLKTVEFPDGKVYTVKKFHYDDPIKSLGGISLNQALKKGAKITTNYDKLENFIKVVKKYNYNGETFNDLPASEWCCYQGFFYPEDINFKMDMRGVKRW
jgi:hypothetical protein